MKIIKEKRNEIISNFNLKGKIGEVRDFILRKYRESIFEQLHQSALQLMNLFHVYYCFPKGSGSNLPLKSYCYKISIVQFCKEITREDEHNLSEIRSSENYRVSKSANLQVNLKWKRN